MKNSIYQECIEACLSCAQVCEECITACLSEQDVGLLTRCIALNRTCVEACYGAARLMVVGGEHATAFCQACADVCEACAAECSRHQHEHCRKCADECRACAETCRTMFRANV